MTVTPLVSDESVPICRVSGVFAGAPASTARVHSVALVLDASPAATPRNVMAASAFAAHVASRRAAPMRRTVDGTAWKQRRFLFMGLIGGLWFLSVRLRSADHLNRAA